MENVPPPDEELAILERELVRLDARRAQLLARRAWLIAALRQPVAPAVPVTPAFAARPSVAQPFVTSAPEASSPSVQNVLLTLGGILLTIAAIAFTLVSWGYLGIGGRSAVLGAVTVAALVAPVALLRRRLASTAESVAALGLVLMVLDAYALHRVALSGTDGLGYAAFASAALAALWTVYGLSFDRLRLPLPVAVLTAQLPLPLWALTEAAGAPPMEWALLATAVLDVSAAMWAKPASLRGIAATGAATTGGWALLIGGRQSVTADTPLDAVAPAALLLVAAGVALYAARRASSVALAASAVAGLAANAAVGGVVRAAVPQGWSELGYLLCAVALLGLVRAGGPKRPAPGLTAAAGAVHALAALSALPLIALTLAGPLSVLGHIWSGTTTNARGALGVELPGPGQAAAPVVLLVVAAVLATASRWLPSPATTHTAPAGSAPNAAAHPSGSSGAGLHPTGTPGRAANATGTPGRAADPTGTTPCPAEAPTAEGRHGRATSTPTHPADETGSSPRPAEQATTEGHPGRATGGPSSSGPAATHPGVPTNPSGSPAGVSWPGRAPAPGAWGTRPAPVAPRPDRLGAAAGAALALAWAGLFVVPPALDLAYPATVALHLVLGVAALVLAVRPGRIARHAPAGAVVALVCGLAGAVSVALLSLATRPATFAVLGTLVAALAAAAAFRPPRAVQAVLACAATAFATALMGAVAASAELPPHRAALTLLVVPATVALLAARLGRHPVALPLELTGAGAGLLASVLATGHRPTLSLVLALCGVIAAGTAVRAERRPAAGILATVLFVLAGWVRLAASDVTAPEAYTLPVTVSALVVGVLRRRRDPEASSWTAYGPGLAATLLPSLLAAWGDEHWLRPLLLGMVALALTLAGARLRLQALLVLAGTALALDALHELAPYVVQVVGALPRWLPPALAGLLLLAVGATYEQRLRDARKLRDTLGRMR
ncbi:SCO7613 C-terminal domain-containing membrane protein [Streptomyces sp. NPDC002926]